jgi:hypothetical protein
VKKAPVPKVITVLASPYQVDVVNKADELALDWHGVTLNAQQRIRLAKSAIKEAPDLARVTLVHEVLHAIVWQHGLRPFISGADVGPAESAEAEEDFVNALANAIYAVLRQNPKLVDFILDDA